MVKCQCRNCGSRGVAHNSRDASKTFKGIAKAMAEQWGGSLLSQIKNNGNK